MVTRQQDSKAAEDAFMKEYQARQQVPPAHLFPWLRLTAYSAQTMSSRREDPTPIPTAQARMASTLDPNYKAPSPQVSAIAASLLGEFLLTS